MDEGFKNGRFGAYVLYGWSHNTITLSNFYLQSMVAILNGVFGRNAQRVVKEEHTHGHGSVRSQNHSMEGEIAVASATLSRQKHATNLSVQVR